MEGKRSFRTPTKQASTKDAKNPNFLFYYPPHPVTDIGKYNPDWSILKHDRLAVYLVRETKRTRDYLKLRTSEADKVRCGEKHFDTIGVPFDVVDSADEV